jgi:hypothetical protein
MISVLDNENLLNEKEKIIKKEEHLTVKQSLQSS